MARTRTLAVLAAAALASTIAGCAAVPSGGAPQKVTGGSGQPQAYALPMPPPPPQAGWSVSDVVLGFLHASASFAGNWAAARQYLALPLRYRWTPGAVTVVAPPSPGSFQLGPPQERTGPGGPTQTATVNFTGQRLATLTTSGQYLYEPGNPVYSFKLVKFGGVWLIDSVPKGVLLLTQLDFQDVYQPNNLYFFAPASQSLPLQGSLLVPDPVYAPIQGITRTTSASNATLATSLVKGLLRGPGSWLSDGATWSSFPVGTTLIGNQVRISGQTAIVNLGGKALTAGDTNFEFMDEQLQATLTGSAYSAPVAHFVRLEIGGNVPYLAKHSISSLIARVGTTPPAPVFFQSGPSSVSQLTFTTASATMESVKAVPVAGPAQIGHFEVTAVAASISYSPRMLAIAAKIGRGCAIYAGISRGSGRYRRYLLSRTGGACTSLSWDRNGNLWVTAGPRVWLIEPDRVPVQISLPAGLTAATAAGRKGLRVLALRMAPDGIRAAFLAQTATGSRVLLAAVRSSGRLVSFGPAVSVGTGPSDARSISWYNPYNLVVLAGSTVYEVPLTGGTGQPRQLGAAPDGAQSITTNGTELVVSTARGGVRGAAANSVINWTRLTKTKGWAPAYPG